MAVMNSSMVVVGLIMFAMEMFEMYMGIGW